MNDKLQRLLEMRREAGYSDEFRDACSAVTSREFKEWLEESGYKRIQLHEADFDLWSSYPAEPEHNHVFVHHVADDDLVAWGEVNWLVFNIQENLKDD